MSSKTCILWIHGMFGTPKEREKKCCCCFPGSEEQKHQVWKKKKERCKTHPAFLLSSAKDKSERKHNGDAALRMSAKCSSRESGVNKEETGRKRRENISSNPDFEFMWKKQNKTHYVFAKWLVEQFFSVWEENYYLNMYVCYCIIIYSYLNYLTFSRNQLNFNKILFISGKNIHVNIRVNKQDTYSSTQSCCDPSLHSNHVILLSLWSTEEVFFP